MVFDVYDGEPEYKALIQAIKDRQCIFAPDVVGHNVPIQPLPNPLTGESVYIIRLTNHLDSSFMVDLLIRDTDQYFIAFRRRRILTEDERATAQIKEGPGTWFRYSDVKLPKSLNTEGENMGLNSSHLGDKTTPGGVNILNEIFFALSRFEDRTDVSFDALSKAVQRVIVVFCEARRLHSIYNEIARRIRLKEDASDLTMQHWKLIHYWDVLSRKVLVRRLVGQHGLETVLSEGLSNYGF